MQSYALAPEDQGAVVSRQMHAGLQQFLCPLLAVLDTQVDRPLVRRLRQVREHGTVAGNKGGRMNKVVPVGRLLMPP